jgi:transcriptional regulator with XRE-family HTH domain
LESITTARIREARLRKGLTLQEAGSKLAKSSGWLSEVERDKRQVTRQELRWMAANYGVPYSYFMRASDLDKLNLIGGKRQLDLGETRRRSLLIIIRDKMQMIEDLEEILKISRRTEGLPAWQGARATAALIRQEVGLGDEDLGSVAELMEKMGILVMDVDLMSSGKEAAEFESASYKYYDRYLAVVSRHENSLRRRELLAKELGMILMHNTGSEADPAEAESFMHNLLLPEKAIQPIYPVNGFLRQHSLECLRYFFGISEQEILKHLKELGRLDEPRYYYWQKKLQKSAAVLPESSECREESSYYRNLLREAAMTRKVSCDRNQEINILYFN